MTEASTQDDLPALAGLDWPVLEDHLNSSGYAMTPPLLSPEQCAQVAEMFDDDARFRSTVIMARHAYGEGSYRYFADPLPQLVQTLRESCYPPLAAIANRWAQRLGERSFPETLDPELLDRAERVSEIAMAPESMMQGYFRRSAGPGWALLGDAGHFKHPGTAQGIGDAVEQAHHLAETLSHSEADAAKYERWRDERAAEHYEWSFAWGHFPNPETGDVLFRDSIGRTDLQGGDTRKILQSIHDKLLVLPDDAIVVPGHGPNTTIGRERSRNPFLQHL